MKHKFVCIFKGSVAMRLLTARSNRLSMEAPNYDLWLYLHLFYSSEIVISRKIFRALSDPMVSW